MTSFAFIVGVLPLVFASGAGAEVRHVMGVTVFAGMIGVTFFGLFFTPVFYVVLRKFVVRQQERRVARQAARQGPMNSPRPARGAVRLLHGRPEPPRPEMPLPAQFDQTPPELTKKRGASRSRLGRDFLVFPLKKAP